MNDVVDLESIRDCLRAGHPAPLATCAPDGTPHISYISQVHYLDSERVATSRQSFNRALSTLALVPFSQALIVCPGAGEQFRLDLRYLHTVTDGDAFEAMRTNLDGIASQMGIGSVFRLRGLDVHRVLRCTRVRREGPDPAVTPDPLAPIEQFAHRLERCTGYEETAQEVLDALEDIFGFPYALLFAPDARSGRLVATAGAGEARSDVGAEVEIGDGLVGMAARRRRLIVTANLARSRAMAETVSSSADAGGRIDIPPAALAGARNAAAIPLIVGEELVGVVYLESSEPGAVSGPAESLLHIIGAHTATAMRARVLPAGQAARNAPAAPVAPHGCPPPLEFVYYQADDTVLCDSEYIVKGAPGRILWAMLNSHAGSGRTEFSNRELRLDESLGLPAGNDNLEARLLVLRRRLASIDCGVTLERVGRGRLELRLERAAKLTVVRTTGPMRSAHASDS
ncbi:MAG: GAF domain-containing protein [Solirubrobacterales bacterium]|nr:GAF domain-containing protein [Solirubrobacterales bacterium]